MVQSNFDPDYALAKDLADLKNRLARLEAQTNLTTVDAGGATGKPLVKVSTADFDTAWQTLGVLGGGTGLATATGYLKGSGTSNMTAVAQIPLNGGTDVTNQLPVANGGTGLSTATGYLKGAGSTMSAVAVPIPVGDGGSGAISLTGYVYGNGASAMTAATTIPASAVSGALAATNMPAGSILQVQSVNSTTQTSYSGGTTFQTIVGMSITVTPRSSSSKFILMASINHANSADASGWWNFFRFARGGTGIGVGTAATVYSSTAMIDPSSSATLWTTSFQYLDSPATASAVTYTVQGHPYDTRTMYINRRTGDLVFNTMSSFILMEVAG